MSYHDLPENLRSMPLRDNVIQSDVIDLMLGEDERRGGALAVMVCDADDRGIQPFVIADVTESAPATKLEPFLDLLLPLVHEQSGAVLVARGRRRGLAPTDVDREWHQAVIDACSRHGVRLLGFHLATPQGIERLPAPLEAAS